MCRPLSACETRMVFCRSARAEPVACDCLALITAPLLPPTPPVVAGSQAPRRKVAPALGAPGGAVPASGCLAGVGAQAAERLDIPASHAGRRGRDRGGGRLGGYIPLSQVGTGGYCGVRAGCRRRRQREGRGEDRDGGRLRRCQMVGVLAGVGGSNLPLPHRAVPANAPNSAVGFPPGSGRRNLSGGRLAPSRGQLQAGEGTET